MNQLPNMSRRESSPKRKQERKKTLPTIATSIVAIIVVMFAMGNFPQVNAFFANINEILRENNDTIVQTLIHDAPAFLVGFAALGLTYMIVTSIRARRHSA